MPQQKSSTGKTKQSKSKQTGSKNESAKQEALNREKKKRHIYSVVLFVLGILVFAFTVLPFEAVVWNGIHSFLRGMFGLSAFAIGPALIYGSIMIANDKRRSKVVLKLIQLIALILFLSAAIQIIMVGHFDDDVFRAGKSLKGGGLVAYVLGYFMLWAFGRVGAGIIIVLIVFTLIMLMGNISVKTLLRLTVFPFKKLMETLKKQREIHRQDMQYISENNNERERLEKKRINPEEINDIIPQPPQISPPVYVVEDEPFSEPFKDEIEIIKDSMGKNSKTDEDNEPPFDIETPVMPEPVDAAIDDFKKEERTEEDEQKQRETTLTEEEIEKERAIAEAFALHQQMYRLPSIDLLDEDKTKRADVDIKGELEKNSQKLIDTLKSFGVMTKIVGVVRGPSVTRYEIQPAPGVKISKITSLTDDIALNLAAAGVRMEAPIPGKSAVGVEVPNATVDSVTIRELIDSKDFCNTASNLGAAVGKAISGEIIISDIAKMPHLLIAGTTGSGKSVCVNSIIMSILYRATPDEVRFIMIDPKLVEFGIYGGIPHLLAPVVTDPKKAAGALKWAVNEMTQRYALFAENNVRDIESYNEKAKENESLGSMAKIVVFIDELADLMMTAAREVEESICRLAQLARAAGIHLVIATQRPTVNVVTGLIKANIPSRIALKVASQVDSRTIIDTAGADKLLGRGDMLYAPVGIPKPIRVQGCWVSSKEIDRVVTFVKENFNFEYDESVIEEIERQALEVNEKGGKSNDDIEDFEMNDEKLEEAIEVVVAAGMASTSLLQRKLSLGYGRAARIIDIMEKMGIVGKFNGSKPREVLMSSTDLLERKNRMNE